MDAGIAGLTLHFREGRLYAIAVIVYAVVFMSPGFPYGSLLSWWRRLGRAEGKKLHGLEQSVSCAYPLGGMAIVRDS